MKTKTISIIAATALLALFSGCSDGFTPVQTETSAGKGTVNITIAGTGERTIFPDTPLFTKYTLSFQALDGQEGHDDVIINAGGTLRTSVMLASGNWVITAKAYVTISGIEGIANGDYRAAQGVVDIYVSTYKETYDISIDIRGGVQSGEKGIFVWDIGFPDYTQSAVLKIRTIEGTEAATKNLMDTPQGKTVLDAGYYLLTLTADDKEPKTEVLHVYGGSTSRLARYLYNVPSFNNVDDMADWLNNATANTVDTPYEIILYDFNLETDFAQNNDYLYKLFNAMNGKYVNLDLSDCAGQSIPNSNSYSVSSRSNRERIVSIVLPAGLTSIGDGAFTGCTSLALTELPAGITSIGSYAFSGCTSLTSITIPAGVTTLPDGGRTYINGVSGYYGVFSGCTNLETVTFEAGSQLKSIGPYAFYGCTSLALTELPAGITSIGYYAFQNCTSLALTELPAGITSIGDQAFYGCTGLALTELPAGITSIGGSAFSGCTGLALTELPAGITSIGIRAFGGCTGLALVICHAVTPPALDPSAFSITLQIKVPAGSVEAYKAASVWSSYASRISAIE